MVAGWAGCTWLHGMHGRAKIGPDEDGWNNEVGIC